MFDARDARKIKVEHFFTFQPRQCLCGNNCIRNTTTKLIGDIRGRTYSTHHEVLVLVLGVETEPNLVVVL